jgi:hypothetical protein
MLEIYVEHGILCLANILVITQEHRYKLLQVCMAEKDTETKLQETPEPQTYSTMCSHLPAVVIALNSSRKGIYPTLAKRSILL